MESLSILSCCQLEKTVTKGYNYYASEQVSEIKENITDGFYHVWSHVMASMKHLSYLCKIVIDVDYSFVLNAECQCVAGRGGKRNNVEAILFALVEFRESQMKTSCTGQPQQWHLSSRTSKKRTKHQTIGETL